MSQNERWSHTLEWLYLPPAATPSVNPQPVLSSFIGWSSFFPASPLDPFLGEVTKIVFPAVQLFPSIFTRAPINVRAVVVYHIPTSFSEFRRPGGSVIISKWNRTVYGLDASPDRTNTSCRVRGMHNLRSDLMWEPPTWKCLKIIYLSSSGG